MKTVLITGASSGIGEALAYVYAEHQYNLILVARRIDNLEAIKKEILEKYKIKVVNVQLDLSKADSSNQLYKFVKAQELTVDVLINNAGFGLQESFTESDIVREEDMINLNILTLTKLTKLFISDMIDLESGHIINIASTAAYQPLPYFAIYGATKSYVLSFSEAIAYELRKSAIKLTVICPGATQSEFANTAEVSDISIFNRAPTSMQLAEYTFESMQKNRTVAVYGLMNRFLVFSQRFLPSRLIVAIAARFFR